MESLVDFFFPVETYRDHRHLEGVLKDFLSYLLFVFLY